MRKTLFTLIMVIIAISANAQLPNRFTLSTSIGTGISMSKPAYTPFTWQVLGHYEINKRFAAGIGTGISIYEKALIPLFADVKLAITKPKKLTPYLACSIGYSFAPDKHTNGGFLLNPSVGMQYKIHTKMQLYFALGYELQKLERLKRYENPLLITEFAEQLDHNSISVKLGISY